MSNATQSTAVANAMTGERSFNTVSFAVTGDRETDLVSAIVACVHTTGNAPTYENPYVMVARVLSYLAKRYSDSVAVYENYNKSISRVGQQVVSGQSSSPQWLTNLQAAGVIKP